MSPRRGPCALTVAGSDGSGGAGVQADLRTFAAFGVYGVSAVTAITAQDSKDVAAFEPVSPRLVARQIEVVAADIGVAAAKTGMLANADVVRAVARALRRAGVPNLIVDPVIAATGGRRLLDPDGLHALRDRLLPLARAVTPNLAEAAALAGAAVDDLDSAIAAARLILDFGPASVIVTGGHLRGAPVDVLVERGGVRRFAGRRVAGGAHGTGCAFSAALAAHLALGAELGAAIRGAKRFVETALARRRRLGRGRHFLGLAEAPRRRGG